MVWPTASQGCEFELFVRGLIRNDHELFDEGNHRDKTCKYLQSTFNNVREVSNPRGACVGSTTQALPL